VNRPATFGRYTLSPAGVGGEVDAEVRGLV
jgi:hypothetical protein